MIVDNMVNMAVLTSKYNAIQSLAILHSFFTHSTCLFKAFCLGGSDIRTEGTFLWNRNSRLITNNDWYPGQPDNGTNAQNQDCVCISSNQGYRWDDMDCEQHHQFICEKPYV